MTKTRVIAALIMAPLAICAIVLLPTNLLAALSAVLFLIGLWEWLK
ncbi:phosphatidate cytidylyltransferase, partial [Xanthomonas perforans]